MCGIAGYLADGPVPSDDSILRAMCDRIAHRGPDASGYFRRGRVALGHRRLSIIDVAGGDQPLGNEDGALQVIFNGEIYNFRELRADLVHKGHRFQTNSDTEVLVHLYEDVGARLPTFLNGMFAFAIWDGRNEELFLARDRFGKKPLYYSTEIPGYRLCFASELKALAALSGFDHTVNPRSVANFLPLSYVPDPDTIFEKVQKLPPAHSLRISRERITVERYWRPAFDVGALSLDQASEELLALSLDSVERRMISDVPLGGFLSGGVDSSAVVAMMSQRAPERVKSFSIGFSNKAFDELSYAKMVAERYRTEHHEHVVTPSIKDMLSVLVDHYDEPFADASAIPTLYLAKMTRQNVTVALSGDGADEIFGGYRRYRFAVAEEKVRAMLPRWFRQSAIKAAADLYPKFDYLPRIFRAKATLTEYSIELGEAYFEAMTGFRWGLYDEILSPELKSRLNGYSPREWFVDKFRAHNHLPPLQQLQAVDLETYLPGDILVKMDRATMAYSLEARAPWLDYRLAELAGRFPAEYKLRNGVGKYLFRQMARPLLPDAIIDRKKMGFGVPMAEWMRTSLKPVFETLVFRPDMGAYISLDRVKKVWNSHQSAQRNYSRELWSILMLACWHNRHGGDRNDELIRETLERATVD